MAFHDRFSKLTAEQYHGIGRVAANWSVVEFALEDILARLAYAPVYFGRALTNDLSMDNRLVALQNLCEIHEKQLGCRIVPGPVIAGLRQVRKETAARKDRRNQITHYVWFRNNDQSMFGIRFRSKPAPDSGGAHTVLTVAEVNQFADEVEALSTRMLDLAKQLPDIEWP